MHRVLGEGIVMVKILRQRFRPGNRIRAIERMWNEFAAGLLINLAPVVEKNRLLFPTYHSF